MDVTQIMLMLKGLSPVVGYVLMGLGTAVIIGGTYVKLTPTQDDDAWWAKLEATPVVGQVLKALVAFSPFQRKE